MKKNAVPLAVLIILLILGLLLGLWADRHPYPKSAEDVNKDCRGTLCLKTAVYVPD